MIGDDPRVEVVLWSTITRESTPTTLILLLTNNNDGVRLIGVYAQYDDFVVLLRFFLLSTLIIPLGLEYNAEIKRLWLISLDESKVGL